MKTIQVTDEQFELLKKLQHELKTQDNLATAHPVFCVFSEKGLKRFATACFTREGCLRFLAADGHNHRSPHIYVESGHRNWEWQELRQFLMTANFSAAETSEPLAQGGPTL